MPKKRRMLNYSEPRGPNLIICLSELRTVYSSMEAFFLLDFLLPGCHFSKAFLFIKLLPVLFQFIFCCFLLFLRVFTLNVLTVFDDGKAPCMLIIVDTANGLFGQFSATQITQNHAKKADKEISTKMKIFESTYRMTRQIVHLLQ